MINNKISGVSVLINQDVIQVLFENVERNKFFRTIDIYTIDYDIRRAIVKATIGKVN